MEIAGLIGMLAAFFAGAYIRQPFWKKDLRAQKPGEQKSREAGNPPPALRASAEAEEERRKREEDRIAQLQNMLNYIGRGQGRED